LKKTCESGIKTQNAVLIITRQTSRSMPLEKHNYLYGLLFKWADTGSDNYTSIMTLKLLSWNPRHLQRAYLQFFCRY